MGRFVLSPDGRWVAYVYSHEGEDGLAIVDAEGQSWPQKLVSGQDFYMQPCWSPDGAQIAHTRRVGAQYDIFVVPAGGDHVLEPVMDRSAHALQADLGGMEARAPQLGRSGGIDGLGHGRSHDRVGQRTGSGPMVGPGRGRSQSRPVAPRPVSTA